MLDSASRLLTAAREERKPAVLEALTYRYRAATRSPTPAEAAASSPEPEPPTEGAPPASPEAAPAPERPSAASLEDSRRQGRVKASPVARRLAREQGIDLATIQGTGPGGHIVKKDVKGATPAAPRAEGVPPSNRQLGGGRPAAQTEAAGAGETAKGETRVQELSKPQEVVARRMAESKATAPHFYLEATIDMSAAVEGRKRLGMFGIRDFGAVINPPQAAILAVGAIEERPVVRDGAIATAQLMDVTLACDHRVLYGAEAAEFLARVRALLEEPLAL